MPAHPIIVEIRRTSRRLTALFSILNLFVFCLALVALWAGSGWIGHHYLSQRELDRARQWGILALLLPSTLPFLRNLRRGNAAHNALLITEKQLPKIHAIYRRHGERLGMNPLPPLYLSDSWPCVGAEAYGAFAGSFIVLNTRFLERKVKVSRATISFFLARELGRIQLGYTSWVYQTLVFYLLRTPWLMNLPGHTQTYLADRFAAWLEPEALDGLLIQAAGRRLLRSTDRMAYLEQALVRPDFWGRAANWSSRTPYLAFRVRALLKAGQLRLPSET